MEGLILYAIGCLTGLLVGLMLLQMQSHFLKHETDEKKVVHHESEAPSSDEDDRLRKQFDNFLSYTGKVQNDN